MLAQMIEDLKLPSYYVRHQTARKQAFFFLSLLVGAATGLSMYYYGYVLAKIALGTILSAFATGTTTFMLFTTARDELAKWIDDKINPAIPVEITSNADPLKTARRDELIKEIRQTASDPIDIAKLKANLKELFELRSYSTMTQDDLSQICQEFNTKYNSLLENIKSAEDWDKPKTIKGIELLLAESVIYNDAVLARMEQDMREAQESVTTENISKRLIKQSTRYCRDFIYSGIIDLYHQFRARTSVTADGFLNRAAGNEHSKKFYEANTFDNTTRKVYNTFVKHGFYQRYGNKAFKEQLLKYPPEGDSRFEHWTQKDSKKTKAFKAFPDTRPT